MLPAVDDLFDLDDPAGSEARCRDVLSRAAETEPAYRAELLTQLARSQGLQRRFDEAHGTLDQAEAILPPEMPRPRIRLLLERGRALNSSGEPGEAHGYFVQAWDLAREAGEDGLAVDAAHMVAIVETPEGQMEWNLRAVELARASSDERARRWLGSLYNNIGWTHHAEGRYAEALVMFQQALAERERQGNPRLIRIARYCVACALRAVGRTAEALDWQRHNLAEIEAAGGNDMYVEEEIGECLLDLGRPTEARPHFARALEGLSAGPWIAEHEPERLARLRELAAED